MKCDKCKQEITGAPIVGGVLKAGTYKVGQEVEPEHTFTICQACATQSGIRVIPRVGE